MFYIYEITNNIDCKTYVGQRKCPENKLPETDKYMGSGVYLRNAKKKYGLENFSKKIIAICETQENADILERVFISLYREMGKAEYNMASGGVFHFVMNDEAKEKLRKINLGKHLSEETKRKISESNKEHYENHPERKLKISKSSKGRPMPDEAKLRIGKANKGRKHSEEFKYNCRVRNLGKHISEETRQKMSESQKGRKHSEETKRKMKENHKGSLGKHWKLSEESKINKSKARKGKSAKWVKNTYWFNNGKINIRSEFCPEGFVKGRLLSNESKLKMLVNLNHKKELGL